MKKKHPFSCIVIPLCQGELKQWLQQPLKNKEQIQKD